MDAIKAEKISKHYRIDGREICVLNNISLGVGIGEFLIISGSSGSGKTTLLSLLSGMDRPSTGRIFLEHLDITDLKEDDLATVRNEKIGFVFQAFHLIPSLTSLENIAFPAELRNDPEARYKAETFLKKVGMAERMNNFPHQLSGGEKQRVAICRALINEPNILFADEPTGNLDTRNSEIVIQLLITMSRESSTTLVLATHSKKIAELSDRVVTLSDGRISSKITNTF
jgi:putative ABC transport system ATP-binding protein